MGRRAPETLNDRMLAAGPREAEPAAVRPRESELSQEPDRGGRIALWLVVLLLLAGLKSVVWFLPWWLQAIAGLFVVTHLVMLFLESTRPFVPRSARVLRVVMYLWFAFCIVVTIPVAAGGFPMEDRAPLGFVWPVLALIWMAYRIRASRHGRADRKLAKSA